ncbi:hypothetical protein GR212_15595 [Rhizobium lusitanum]|uniref:Uncharacterized protein n=1 Tax=Rhizobium lusitanum TaxID=293958 RepID=A0A6L9U9L1_9HYPH|nr:VWA-like domain-containing protein [Rhizobium lusitanum]NEI71002.1 hypothetical protein [Rhizobium lusitanum]
MSALQLVDNARAILMTEQPFYATLSLHLELFEDATCKEMWTDGARLGFNPSFVEGLKPSVLRSLVASAVSSCARLHHIRRGNRAPEDWKKACAYSVNPELKQAGFNLPEGALINPAYADLSEEEIFQRLQKAKKDGGNSKPKDQQGGGTQSAPSAGSGKPDGNQQGTPGDQSGAAMVEIRDAAPAHEPDKLTASENDWKANVRQALAVAKAHNAGSIPGFLQEIDAVTIAPVYNWKEELRAFIDQSSVKDYSWMNPNRRYIGAGLILPGLVADSLSHVVYVIDDSSSIDQDAFGSCSAEAKAALDEGAADRITVVFCNVVVHHTLSFERGDDMQITARGSGGTRFAPAFEWIEDNAPDASAIVYLTDLDCKLEHFGQQPAAPVIWAAYGERSTIARRAAKVPFGEVIHLPA